jgi:hypothetical protein
MENIINEYQNKIKVFEIEINEMDKIVDGIRLGNKTIILNEREKIYNNFYKKLPSTLNYDKNRRNNIYKKYCIKCNEILEQYDNDLGITEEDLINEKNQKFKFIIL